MQQLDQAAALPVELEAESRAQGELLLTRAHEALKRLDIAECSRITDTANTFLNPANGPALCALLRKPRNWKGIQAWKREPWVAMRISAIQALARTRDQLAAPTLANVLLHDMPAVREEASAALRELGPNAVLSIVDNMRVSTDWPIEGMLRAIETLGLICDNNAGPTLARILFGLLPATPKRWLILQFKWAAVLGAIETAGVWVLILGNNMDPGPFYVVALSASMMFGFFTFLSAMGVGIFIRKGKSNEANRINAAAADALIGIKDPRSVPSLIEVATEKYPQSARAGAIHALRETLPVLNASDYGLLTGAVERRLTGMFAINNPQLTLATVRALEFVGSGQSVAPVDRLARRKITSNSAISPEIRSEAERVLPVLVERKRLEEASSVLLRPSHVAPDTAAILLRPVSSLSAYEEPIEQLLRPGQAE